MLIGLVLVAGTLITKARFVGKAEFEQQSSENGLQQEKTTPRARPEVEKTESDII